MGGRRETGARGDRVEGSRGIPRRTGLSFRKGVTHVVPAGLELGTPTGISRLGGHVGRDLGAGLRIRGAAPWTSGAGIAAGV